MQTQAIDREEQARLAEIEAARLSRLFISINVGQTPAIGLCMTKLKLSTLDDDKPVKLTVELPAAVHRDLVAYAEVLARHTGQPIPDPAKLVTPMVQKFMATDRGFAKAKKGRSDLVRSR